MMLVVGEGSDNISGVCVFFLFFFSLLYIAYIFKNNEQPSFIKIIMILRSLKMGVSYSAQTL